MRGLPVPTYDSAGSNRNHNVQRDPSEINPNCGILLGQLPRTHARDAQARLGADVSAPGTDENEINSLRLGFGVFISRSKGLRLGFGSCRTLLPYSSIADFLNCSF